MITLNNNHAEDTMYSIQLIKNFDDLELTEWDRTGPYPKNNWTATENLFRAALIWACGEAAAKATYLSDSHVDDQYCLARFICHMTDILYGYDQTMNLDQAIQKWLDDDNAIEDLIYVANLLNGQTPATTPLLFDHFQFTPTDD